MITRTGTLRDILLETHDHAVWVGHNYRRYRPASVALLAMDQEWLDVPVRALFTGSVVFVYALLTVDQMEDLGFPWWTPDTIWYTVYQPTLATHHHVGQFHIELIPATTLDPEAGWTAIVIKWASDGSGYGRYLTPSHSYLTDELAYDAALRMMRDWENNFAPYHEEYLPK